jgi:hypothetical protein
LQPFHDVSETLKRRLREHPCRGAGDEHFVARLLESIGEIESRFEGDERARLLQLAEETFERHVGQREHTRRLRRELARLQADQRRLVDLLDASSARPSGRTLH